MDYYLAQELARKIDGELRLGTCVHKPRGGKLTFGPLWNFDITPGNVNYGNGWVVAGWQLRKAPQR